MNDLLITPTDASKLTGISVSTIHAWCRDKQNGFPSFRVGRDFKIVRREFEDWLTEAARGRAEL